MKANELRIGNYVYDVDMEISRVEQIGAEEISGHQTLSSKSCSLYSSKIFPIPLKEEWFLKLGLLPVWYGYEDIEHREFEISTENEGVYRLSVNSNEYVIGEPIKFVHQLQNLYFSLNGEELEIKL